MDSKDQIVKKFHPHPLSFLRFYLLGVIFIVVGILLVETFSFFGILIGVFILLFGEISRQAETFYILESGVGRGYSLLSTSRKFIEYEKIQNIEVNQSFLENIFGIGSIEFDTAGGHDVELNFYAVKHPYDIERIIRDKMAAMKK